MCRKKICSFLPIEGKELVASQINEDYSVPVSIVENVALLEELPDWARPVIEPLVESGAIEGEGDGLNLSYDLVRTLVILARVLGWPGT